MNGFYFENYLRGLFVSKSSCNLVIHCAEAREGEKDAELRRIEDVAGYVQRSDSRSHEPGFNIVFAEEIAFLVVHSYVTLH